MRRMTFRVAMATDVGLRRTQNEDHHGSWIPSSGDELERLGALVVIADGMGGSQAGEVASRLAVETVLKSYRASSGVDPAADLRRAVEEANRTIHDLGRTSFDLGGMGTTLTALVVRGTEAFVAHVGDSRAYLVNRGGISQLTQDHSLVAQLVREHALTAEQARVDPRRNVVTRSVGVGETVEVDAFRVSIPLQIGDTLILCSDGLHGQVTDEEIAAFATEADLGEACQRLISTANQRGGPDNITVVVGQMSEEQEAPGGSLSAVPAHEGTSTARASAPEETQVGPGGPDAGRRPAVRSWQPSAAIPVRKRSQTRTLIWLLVVLIVLAAALVGIAWLVRGLHSEIRTQTSLETAVFPRSGVA
jgi:PPM family protein phosphatase